MIETRLEPSGLPLTLVPVGAILVASIRLHFLDLLLHHAYEGPKTTECDARLRRGQEMGWFEHGSTIIVFVPPGVQLAAGIATNHRIKAGEPLFVLGQD